MTILRVPPYPLTVTFTLPQAEETYNIYIED